MSLMMKAVAPAVSALALVFMVGATNAADATGVAPKGPTAQQAEIQCYQTDDLKNGLKKEFNMEAKESGDHPSWRLQIYANDAGGWFLAGEPKDNKIVQGATPDMKLSCLLEGDTKGGYPDQVKQTPWHKQFFQHVLVPSI